jgi:hypothetical protein
MRSRAASTAASLPDAGRLVGLSAFARVKRARPAFWRAWIRPSDGLRQVD